MNDELLNHEEPSAKRDSKRIVWILLAVFGLAFLIICGGCIGLLWKAKPDIISDPATIAEMTDAMLPITIPDQFEPEGAVSATVFGTGVQIVMYETAEGEGLLKLMQMSGEGVAQDDVRDQVEQAMQEQTGVRAGLTVQETEVREFSIRGRDVSITFSEAIDEGTGERFHLVEGVLPGDGGPVALYAQLDEEAWDEEMIVQMLESLD